jgi:hypothetical protein
MPTLRLDGDGTGAVKAFTDLDRAVGKVGDTLELTAKEAKKLELAAANVVKANEGPLEKYNRRMAELNQLVKTGKLSHDEAALAAQRYVKTLERAGDTHQRAFGAKALSEITSMATGLVSVTTAMSLLVDGFAQFQAAREKAAQGAIAGRRGLGSLSQLAAGTADPEGEFKKMVAEARGFVGMGAAENEDEAGNLLFQLSGAGLDAKDRAYAARLKSAGTLQNVGGAAEAYSALKTALGSKEVGGFQEFMSKALRAAGPAPGSFEQLPLAASMAGGSAAALGISDEFLLAATTILGKKTGSISEGGTQLSAMLAQVEKSGLPGTKGVGGMGIIDALSRLPESQQGYGGPLGERKEAVEAFRTLKKNRAELLALQADVIAAEGSNLAGRAAGLAATDPQLNAAIRRKQAEGARDVQAGGLLGEGENLKQAALAEFAFRQRRDNPTWQAETAIATYGSKFFDTRAALSTDFFLQRTQEGGSAYTVQDPKLSKDIAGYLKRISDRQGAKAATRDE